MYRTCERSFHEKKLLNATLLFYEGWQRNKGELIPLETRGTRSLFEGSACPDEKIQRFLDKSMVRTFLNRCNIYISIRLIFNTTNVRPSIYYLIFAGKWTRNFDRSIVLASSFVYSPVCYCPIHLKYTKQLRRNVVHYLRKEICFSEYIYVYIQNEAADMQLKSAASGPVSRQGWTTLWKEGAFILRKEIYGTRVVCHQVVWVDAYYFYVCIRVALQWFSSGETCISLVEIRKFLRLI